VTTLKLVKATRRRYSELTERKLQERIAVLYGRELNKLMSPRA